MNKSSRKSFPPSETKFAVYEAEVAEGLEAVARDEINDLLGKQARNYRVEKGVVRFSFAGKPQTLFKLRTVNAVYSYLYFDVPRPRALLGHEHFSQILQQIETIRALSPRSSYETFHISAAGSESSVMNRLKDELVARIKLSSADDKGDLLIRIRRSGQGWEMLIRLTPRPLATRSWRVCNFEGALNASVAHAMVLLTPPSPEDTFLNIACGSGSLLVERLEATAVKRAIGCDIDPQALDCAQQNLRASRTHATLLHCDARTLPLAAESVDVLCADLPFGQLVGTHEENVSFYPALLREAARIARHEARFVLITHEVRLMESLLRDSVAWTTENMLRVTLGGLHPRIYVLRKS